MAKKKYERLSNKEFYTVVAMSMGVLFVGMGAINALNFPKTSKIPKQEMKLEKIADMDTFETIEPFYDEKNDSVFFNVQDRKNHVDYGQLKGGNLKLYDLNHKIVFDKNFKENEIVEVKSEYLTQDRYMVKYSSADRYYNITFKK